jgi:hypothetical protein
MFVGHYSAAFLAKRVAPEIPLPVYFFACQTIDLFWAVFVLLGIEKVRYVENITATNSMDLYFMPFTHSLPGAILWSCGVAALVWLFSTSKPQRVRYALLFAAVVVSHWVFDFFAHRPDLPLWYDSFKVGLGLWNFKIFELLLELTMLWVTVFFVLPVVGQNRTRVIALAWVMTGFQIISVVISTPKLDYQIALQLLASYTCLTVLSYFADKKKISGQLPVHSPE